MTETLNLISLVSFIASAVFMVLALFFFFLFRIPSVIGDLSGRTARKSISRKRRSNEKSGSKAYRSSDTNLKRGKLTESIAGETGRSGKRKGSKPETAGSELVIASMDDRPETGLLNENKAAGDPVDDGATTELMGGAGGEYEEEGTVELDAPAYSEKKADRRPPMKLSMLDEVILVHTDEEIP